MLAQLRPALVMIVLFSALTGIAYPLAITGIAQLTFPGQAYGSLIERGGKIAGSALIGQNFSSDRYFHGRPSATTTPDPADPSKTVDAPYNAANSSGSNLGPTSKKLVDRIGSAIAAGIEAGYTDPFLADAVTASASGLDPHISPGFAVAQAETVAKARNLPLSKVQALIEAHIEPRSAGLFGEPRVNVLLLNLALDDVR
ncbi:MAG: potassium-transporting ATPase subunit KdpC [Methylocapsa sp.]|nr:potassium-transporting ATPase subunit KdpC [Methylocapsa sp.]